MASLGMAIQQVRRARRRVDTPTTENFDQYRPAYEAILEAVADLAGDPAFDELKQWMIETTEERKKLPTPTAVRKRAREICDDRNATVAPGSPLRG